MDLTLHNELGQCLVPTGMQSIVPGVLQRSLVDDQVVSLPVLLEPVLEGLLPGQLYPVLQPGQGRASKSWPSLGTSLASNLPHVWALTI